jgi:transposase
LGCSPAAFRPAEEIAVLRAYLRQREMLVKDSASHKQHIQKALQQMNLRLDNVVSDITGETGIAILKAILGGERNPAKLARHRNYRCHATEAEIRASLQGNYRAEHLFALEQAVEL